MPIFDVHWDSSVSILNLCRWCSLNDNGEKQKVIKHGPRKGQLKSSTVHGWIVKWRATFSGNEASRDRGIREMRQASADRRARGGFFGQLFARRRGVSGRSRRSSYRPSPSRRHTTEGTRPRSIRQSLHHRQSYHRPSAGYRRSTRWPSVAPSQIVHVAYVDFSVDVGLWASNTVCTCPYHSSFIIPNTLYTRLCIRKTTHKLVNVKQTFCVKHLTQSNPVTPTRPHLMIVIDILSRLSRSL